ncbi:MAG: hypothetical protein ACR2OZ_21210 [Verrucomicrobiales bacterium]
MNLQSAALRIVCGLAIAGVAAYVYSTIKPDVENSDQQGALLFGQQIDISPSVLLFIVAAVGIVGVLFAVLGVIQLLRPEK